MEWIPGGIILIVINILVWAFLWGKTLGKINTRLTVLEKSQDDPPMLPECQILFSEIKEGLANLDGKVSTMLITMKENQRNSEKKHIGG